MRWVSWERSRSLLFTSPISPLLPLHLPLPHTKKSMAEGPSTVDSIRKWIVDHKLRTVGCLWLSGIGGSIAYNWSRPNMKTSVKIIHARLNAQALTLAALAGAAAVEYYERQSKLEPKAETYAKQIFAVDAPVHKD